MIPCEHSNFYLILAACGLHTYRGKAATHVSIGHGEAGLVDGLLKYQVDDAFEPLFCVDGQVRHLLHQLVELLRRQLVQDAAYLLEKLLRGISHDKKHQSIILYEDYCVKLFQSVVMRLNSLFFFHFCPQN